MRIATPVPRQLAPALSVGLVGGGTWSIVESKPANFTLIVFYRGLHCPVCSRYLADLESKLDEFAGRGVEAIAISSETEARGTQTKTQWKLDRLRVGYGLRPETALAWGLHLSKGRGANAAGIAEPDLFSEPGLFLVRPDGTFYFASTQTMPFARPPLGELLPSLDFALAKNYPARGEIVEI